MFHSKFFFFTNRNEQPIDTTYGYRGSYNLESMQYVALSYVWYVVSIGKPYEFVRFLWYLGGVDCEQLQIAFVCS